MDKIGEIEARLNAMETEHSMMSARVSTMNDELTRIVTVNTLLQTKVGGLEIKQDQCLAMLKTIVHWIETGKLLTSGTKIGDGKKI